MTFGFTRRAALNSMGCWTTWNGVSFEPSGFDHLPSISFKPGSGESMADFHLPLRSEEHTSELQSQSNLVCRLLLEKKKKRQSKTTSSSPPAYELLLNYRTALTSFRSCDA